MFEDSLMESQGRLVSRSRRWITVGSVGLQCLVAVVVVVVPMVHPEALPFRAMAPAVVIPAMRKPPVVVREVSHAAAASSAPALPTIREAMPATRVATLPSMRPAPDEGVGVPTQIAMGPMSPVGAGIFGTPEGTGPRVTVAPPKRKEPVAVSSGVVAGLLMGEIRPVYPRIAIAAHQSGTVVIAATISKAGTIEAARVVSGPAMLAGAALDAVKAARYRPYLLNGEATEVQTTVTVVFRMGEG